MPDKFEITVPLPPEMVIKRLEAARKEMAPKIGPCTPAVDKSSFICQIDYANAWAYVKGSPTANGTETKVFIDVHAFGFWTSPFYLGGIIVLALLGVQVLAVIARPKTVFGWLSVPLYMLAWVLIQSLLAVFAKHVLNRFVRDTLLNETQT